MKLDKNKLFKLKKALLALAEIATEEGVTLITDNELEVGAEVFVNGEEGLVPASDGEYSYNNMVITVEGGVVTAIADKPVEEETPVEETVTVTEETAEETPAEEVVDETPAETESTEETAEEVAEVAEEVAQEATEEVVDVEALKNRIAELEALVEELKKKLEAPVAESVEEEMKKEEKKNEKTNKRDYVAMMRKAREIKENKNNKE